jgi:hypothetical protein
MAAPRYVANRDGNHKEITQALEKIGCSVYDASAVGGSFPDLVVGKHGITMLIEVKTPKGRLKEGQEKWHSEWKGHTCIVRSPMEAVEAVQHHVKAHQSR